MIELPKIAELLGTTISDMIPPNLISLVSKKEKIGISCARCSNASLISCTAVDPEDRSLRYPRLDPATVRTLLSVLARSEPPCGVPRKNIVRIRCRNSATSLAATKA